MLLAKLDPSKEHLLEFSINIQGTLEKVSDTRFVIENKGFDLSFPCDVVGDKVVVKIPKLNETISTGIKNSRLEVVVGGDKIFTPLRESLEILENIKIQVKESVESNPVEIKVDVSQDDDFQIVEEYGHKLLKKSGLYYGIIGETKTLRSTDGYESVESLVRHFAA